jgi:cyclopropane-fatty-acyl-phospholipid synthase
MIEAVGFKNLGEYYDVIKRCLKDGDLALMQGNAANRSVEVPIQLWILNYIPPNGFLPPVAQMITFSERKLMSRTCTISATKRSPQELYL